MKGEGKEKEGKGGGRENVPGIDTHIKISRVFYLKV